jgi:hypothetical protein
MPVETPGQSRRAKPPTRPRYFSARQNTARLIRDSGFDPIDAGALRSARFIEPFTLLIARLAYEGDTGPELAYRFEHLGGRRSGSTEPA